MTHDTHTIASDIWNKIYGIIKIMEYFNIRKT